MNRQSPVLVIGGGSIGERHVRCFQQTGRADVALCEVNAEVRDRVASKYNLRGAFHNLASAIAERPEIAIVCTPAPLHTPMSIQLAEAGIHLLIEKPLSTSLDGIDRLQSIVNERKLVAAVAYVYRSHPILKSMRQEIQSGRFGRPLELVYVGGQNFPHFRPAYREIYYAKRETGGGAIQDGLTHLMNAGEWLVGPVTRVAADAEHLVLEGVDVEDTVHVLARHGSVLASYSMNQHQAPNESTITVVCDHATVRFEGHENRWRWKTSTDEPWHDEVFPPIERDTAFIAQANSFLDAAENSATPFCSLAEGLQTLWVNLALLKAADTHTWQTISD